MTRSTNARVAGSAYLTYIAVGVFNEVLMYRATNADGIAATLARMADYSTDVRLAIIMKLGECFSVFVLAVALYVMRPPASRPNTDAMITIAPPPRSFMCGTARRDARIAGNSV